jgi:small subunit ribosomal protein S7
MPRRKKKEFTRDIGVDPRFQSPFMQKLINVVMRKGKKNAARVIVYEAMDVLVGKCENSEEKALELFQKAFAQATPSVEVRSRRVGSSVYQIPRPVRPERARHLALKWVLDSASSRGDKTMGRRLAHELLDASEGRGNAVKKKVDVHKMADSNRAFSHYAW